MVDRPTAIALRALGLGDFVTGLPALALLRHALPEHRIVLCTPKAYEPLAALSDVIDTVLDVDSLAVTGAGPVVGPESPDVAVNLHGRGPQSHRWLQRLHPGRIVAFENGVAGVSGPSWRAGEPEVARWCRLVADAFGLGHRDGHIGGCLAVPDRWENRPAATVLHPGASAAARRWPPERFGAVATELYRLGHRVVVTAGPGEEQVAELIADRSHAEALPGLPLEELASLIAHARLVISGDTGVAHLASAYARPSVTLFGPVSPSEWGPPEHPRHQVLFVGNGKGDPHAERCDPALLAISVSDVLAASERAIRTDHSGVPARPDRSSTTR